MGLLSTFAMLLRMGFCSRMALTELSVCEKESFLCILFCELPVNYDHFFQGCLPFFHDNARFVKKVSICVVAILFVSTDWQILKKGSEC